MKKFFLAIFFASSISELVFLFVWPVGHLFSKPLIVLSLMGYYWVSAERKSTTMLLALIFCWLGDLFLLAEDFFILGLVAFLIGHVLYMITYRQHRWVSATKEFLGTQKARFAFPIVFFGFGLVTVLFNKLGDLKLPVLVYASVLTLMCLFALFRFGRTSDRSFFFVLTGALFFMISDSLLAINKFLSPFELSGFSIMLTYCAAQYLIVQGLLTHPSEK